MNTVELKEGQTYVCVKSSESWWTEGKEYEVVLNSCNELCLVDDECYAWAIRYLKPHAAQFKLKEENKMSTNQLITLTRIDDTKLYVNINHIAAFYHNKAWEYTIVILSDGTQLDIKDSVESIAEYF